MRAAPASNPVGDPGPHLIGPVAGLPPSDTLVGRTAELAELGSAVQGASAGRGQLVLLSGEAGVGKTALIEATAEHAREAGLLVLRGRCWSGDGIPPCWPWTQVLRAALPRAPESWPPRQPELAPLVPELAPDGATAPDLPAGPARFRLYDAVRGALADLARHRPVLVVLDELDAAAPPTLELLHLLSHELDGLPLSVVGAYRPLGARRDAQVDRMLAAVSREAVLLPLAGLGEADVAALLARTGGEPDPALVRRVREATAGNALLVTELAGGLTGRSRTRTPEPLPLSERLRGAVRRRLEPLDHAARTLLGPAAVLGTEVDAGRLGALLGMPRGPVLEALGEAIDAGLLDEVVDRPGRFRFRHAIVQQAVLADLSPAERADLHLRAAAAIEERHARDIEPHLAALARHYAAGAPDDVTRAVEVSVRAARRAAELLELDEAAALWRLALDQAGRGGADRLERCDLLRSLGDALGRAGDNVAARRTFLEAARVARAAGDDARFAWAVLGCGGGASTPTTGVVDGPLVDLLGEALERIGPEQPVIRSALLGRLAMERCTVDPRETLERLVDEAVDLARRTGDRAALGRALNARYHALWHLDDVEGRLADATHILDVARDADDPDLALRALAWRVVAFLELGDAASADREIGVHARLADALAQPYHRWMARVLQGMRALLEGRFGEAERHADAALELGARLDATDRDTSTGPNARLVHGVQHFALRHEQGRLPELARPVDRLTRDHPDVPVWRCAQALLRLRSGRVDEAREALALLSRHGFQDIPADGSWLVAVTLLAEVAAGLGDVDAARALTGLLTPHAERVVVSSRGASCNGAVAHHLGVLAAARGEHEAAVHHLERALVVHESIGARPAGVRTRLALAASLRALGRAPGRTSELLRSAHAAGAELGMEAAAREAEQALADVGTLPQLDAPVAAAGARPVARLRRQEGRWTVVFDGRASQLRDAKGVRYLAMLLAEPGVDHPAAVLERRARGGAEAERAAGRQRFLDLREELVSAEAAGDPGGVDDVRARMAALAVELTGGGQDRAEQARVNVTRAIRTALRNVRDADAGLADHLERTVRTGASCAYRPDPRAPITWYVEADAQAAS